MTKGTAVGAGANNGSNGQVSDLTDTPAATATVTPEDYSSSITENAVLNDLASLPSHIIRNRNEDELWDNLDLEKFFDENLPAMQQNQLCSNGIENTVVEEPYLNSNNSNSSTFDSDFLETPSSANDNTSTENFCDSVINNNDAVVSAEHIERQSNSSINVGIQIDQDGTWHEFSPDRLLGLFFEHVNDLTPLQIQILYSLISTGVLLRIYFRTMGPFCNPQIFEMPRPNIRRPERAVIFRAPRFVRRIFPRFPRLVTGIVVRTMRLLIAHNLAFLGMLASINLTVGYFRYNFWRDFKDSFNKDKKLIIPFINIPAESIKDFFNWVDLTNPGQFSFAFGLLMLLYAIYLLAEIILLIIIHFFGTFNIKSKKNKWLRKYLTMINKLYFEPIVIKYLFKVFLATIKVSFVFIVYGYIMILFTH